MSEQNIHLMGVFWSMGLRVGLMKTSEKQQHQQTKTINWNNERLPFDVAFNTGGTAVTAEQ